MADVSQEQQSDKGQSEEAQVSAPAFGASAKGVARKMRQALKATKRGALPSRAVLHHRMARPLVRCGYVDQRTGKRCRKHAKRLLSKFCEVHDPLKLPQPTGKILAEKFRKTFREKSRSKEQGRKAVSNEGGDAQHTTAKPTVGESTTVKQTGDEPVINKEETNDYG